jgi:4-methylaminobutanoate oxidase (formaldehyde-forming)
MVGDAPAMALRVTYVGELGWELYAPTEFGAGLFDLLLRAGEPFGIVPAGYRAIDTLRLEKGYLAWGSDLTPEGSPLEAGLAFAVRADGDRDFLGKASVERLREEGVTRRLATLVLEDPRAMVLGVEPVFHGEEVVARVTSGGPGYAVGVSIALAYLPAALAEPGTELAVRVFDRLVPATVVKAPLWDPANDRIRG